MAKSKEWKDRRAHVLPGRMEYAKKRFAQEGITVVNETDVAVIVRCGCSNVTYYPFTGGFTGKGLGCGLRGLENLIDLCVGRR